MNHGTLEIPKAFFVSERRVYANWPEAFWRELLSNSLDAGASRIRIHARPDADGGAAITVADNGSGMDLTTAESVYLKLGGSAKQHGSIGGFGRARILTCFSAEQYQLRSADYRIDGSGASYTITTGLKPIKGLAVRADLSRTDIEYLFHDLRTVLAHSALPFPIELSLADGHRRFQEAFDDLAPDEAGIARFRAWARNGKKLETLTHDGEIVAEISSSFGKTARHGKAIIRVNGLAMHSFGTRLRQGMLVFDLPPEKSRDIMTANRDSLRWEYEDVIRQYVAHVEANSRASMGMQATTMIFGDAFTGLPMDSFATGGEIRSVTPATPQADGLVHPVPETHGHARPAPGIETQSVDRDTFHQEGPDWNRLPCIVHIDEDATPGQRAAMRDNGPQNWPQGEGRNVELINAAFRGAVRHHVRSLIQLYPSIGQDMLATGLLASSSASGLHRTIHNTHVVLFNPFTEKGNIAFKTTSKEDLKRISATAMHEVAHILIARHDEDYAMVLTQLAGKSLDRELFREMDEEMDAVRNLRAETALAMPTP